jgi:5-methyltetrahydrofolate--homocysteine methyltransferase
MKYTNKPSFGEQIKEKRDLMETNIDRNGLEIAISRNNPTVIIGERINPTGKNWLKEALLAGEFEILGKLAQDQVAAGAQIIDINVMVAGLDEVDTLPRAVEAVQKAVDVPLCLDSSRVEALKAGLATCDGKVIVNSVNGDQKNLDRLLPLIKEHQSAIIGVLMNKEMGIPKTAEGRLEIAGRILEAVEAAGIPKSDLIIDCLALAVSVEQHMGRVALETIDCVSKAFDLNIIMGISNVSFGLPERSQFNSSFVAMAAGAGMTCVIANPQSKAVREAILVADVLLGRDQRAKNFLEYYRAQKNASQ